MAPQTVVLVNCLICGTAYPAEDGLRARAGRHFWTCSDECQAQFATQGGLGANPQQEQKRDGRWGPRPH